MTRHEPSVGSALWLPLFDELSDPLAVARVAAEAEEAGWHGVFVWDHLRWRPPVTHVADAWITLAAIAQLRRHTTAAYDIAVGIPIGVDPLPYVQAGATWWMPELPPETLSLDTVQGVLRDGPLTP